MYYNLYYYNELIGENIKPSTAESYAEDWWADKNEELSNGKTAEDVVEIVAFDENENELSRYRYKVSFTGYHGDYAEHNTHWGL